MTSETQLLIVSCGPGSTDLIPPAARLAVASAQVVFGSPRLLDLFVADTDVEFRPLVGTDAVDGALEVIEKALRRQSVAVLVSGDAGLCSFGAKLTEHFGRSRCRIVPGISSVQLAFSRMGMDWTDTRVISAHGRTPTQTYEELQASDRIAILAGGDATWPWIASAVEALGQTHAAVLCENLSLPDERITRLNCPGCHGVRPSTLSVVLLVNRTLL